MNNEGYTLPPGPAPTNHGNTRSAWVLTLGVLLGLTIVGVGMSIPHAGLLISGLVITGISGVAAWILRAQGYGQPVPARSDDWYEG